MVKNDRSDVLDDIRWSTLCHRVDALTSECRMNNLERINVGAYLIVNVVKNMPQDQQFRWFSYVMQELCSKAAELDIQSIAETTV